jgi:hypothetical protein
MTESEKEIREMAKTIAKKCNPKYCGREECWRLLADDVFKSLSTLQAKHEREVEELKGQVALIKKQHDFIFDERADHEQWLKEVLTDFKIPFDDHKQGMRAALCQWMIDHRTDSLPPSAALEAL